MVRVEEPRLAVGPYQRLQFTCRRREQLAVVAAVDVLRARLVGVAVVVDVFMRNRDLLRFDGVVQPVAVDLTQRQAVALENDPHEAVDPDHVHMGPHVIQERVRCLAVGEFQVQHQQAIQSRQFP